MIAKKHRTKDGKLILAVCDTEIFGKEHIESIRCLDLTSEFYNGDEMDKPTVLSLMKKAYMLNLAGEKSIKLAIDNGFIIDKNIKMICKIPYAQALVLTNSKQTISQA